MSDNEAPSTQLERRLHEELDQLDRKIGDLLKERESIRRILIRVRHETKLNVDITRKNSFNRISAEHAIIETLKASKKPVSTRRIAVNVRSVVYNLNDNTYRSYLSRMKARGLIVSKGSGVWALPEPPQKI